MIIIHQPATVLDFIYKQKAKGFTIGFVPTMGALHQGHIDLVKTAVAQCQLVVVSIFVNPTQFNEISDFEKYPNRREQDIRMLAAAGAHLLFLPPVEAIYPAETGSLEHYDLGYLETILEGRFRPGHFQGVCQVMSRLLKAVEPHLLFMGQKDYQQCMVVNKLLELLHINTQLIACPTIREKDGLAMSSRNLRLNHNERQRAPAIYQALVAVKHGLPLFGIEAAITAAKEKLESQGFKIDYLEVAAAADLSLSPPNKGEQLVALVAAFLGPVRLIDNMLLN